MIEIQKLKDAYADAYAHSYMTHHDEMLAQNMGMLAIYDLGWEEGHNDR